MNATVNTNLSAVTDPVGNRGNIPNGVMALPLTDPGGSGTTALTFGATLGAGIDPTIGSYTAALTAVSAGGAGAGRGQLVTITFNPAHGWTADTHDLDIQLVGAADQDLNTVVGECSGGSFGTTTTLSFVRQVGGFDDGAGGAVTVALAACTALITVRKRGVAHVPA